MRRANKPRPPKRRNPLARLVRQPAFKPRVKASKRTYARKLKHPEPPESER